MVVFLWLCGGVFVVVFFTFDGLDGFGRKVDC